MLKVIDAIAQTVSDAEVTIKTIDGSILATKKDLELTGTWNGIIDHNSNREITITIPKPAEIKRDLEENTKKLASNDVGITGGKVAYFAKGDAEYGVRIDAITFAGQWCSHTLLADNRQCAYEIDLYKKGGLLGDDKISKNPEIISEACIIGDRCPSDSLIDTSQLDNYHVTCPNLASSYTTNFKITDKGVYYIKVRMIHNDFEIETTHTPLSLDP